MNVFTQIIKGTETQALTPVEVRKIARYDAPFYLYEHLISYKKLANLFIDSETGEMRDAVIILYQATRYSGHYVCILRRDNFYEFFDSYALRPDEQLEYAHYVQTPYLRNLMSGEKVIFNTIPLQSDKSSISTCGRFAGVRIAMRDLTMQEFYDFFRGSKKNADDLVTLMTLLDKN